MDGVPRQDTVSKPLLQLPGPDVYEGAFGAHEYKEIWRTAAREGNWGPTGRNPQEQKPSTPPRTVEAPAVAPLD